MSEQRLIDANALIENAQVYEVECGDEIGDDVREIKAVAVSRIENAPTIGPVKHGHWIDGTSFGGVRCSECGYGAIIMLHYSSSFCPNCGCDMSGGNNGKE